VIATCVSGWDDCDSAYDNGCEATIGSTEHCLGCHDRCGWFCDSSLGCRAADFVSVATQSGFACALTDQRELYCWGGRGFLGDGTEVGSTRPVRASFDSEATRLSVGNSHACVATASGLVSCWGSNTYGQLGTGDDDSRLTPVAVAGLTNVTQVSAGGRHTCAVTTSGGLWCWGGNSEGQLGLSGENQLRPRFINLTNVAEVAAGQLFTCARRTDGSVWCWGGNGLGQLGDGQTANQTFPRQVPGLTGVRRIAAGNGHACASTATTTYCWGRDSSGQIGPGNTSGSSVVRNPTEVPGVGSAIELSLGDVHSCAIAASGAWCWGSNVQGQIGDGTSGTIRRTPVALPVADPVRVAAGAGSTCAVDPAGAIWCWGRNAGGQLGDGTLEPRLEPVRVGTP
jgi:alpha-tubulin suppressor-like RCC1 family protein